MAERNFNLRRLAGAVACMMAGGVQAQAPAEDPPVITLMIQGASRAQAPAEDLPINTTGLKFQNVVIRGAQIFSGCSPNLVKADVLVAGNLVKAIAPGVAAPKGAFEIDGEGHTLIPGLIDAHWHGLYAEASMLTLYSTGEGYWNLMIATFNRNALMRGFTTVRDAAGPTMDVAKATNQGLIVGPRVFPSGPAISQTGGHMDYRWTRDLPATPDKLNSLDTNHMAYIADGVPEVQKRVRENLMAGATQIKVMAGGGVSSTYDPIDTIQYTPEELKAAVVAASNWGTYVMTHAIADAPVNQAIEAGVKSIEHAHLATRKTLERMKEKGVWLSTQPFLADEDAPKFTLEGQRAKYKQVTDGTDFIYKTAKELGVKIAFGTDTLFAPEQARKMGAVLAKLERWFTPYEALKMATCDNAELLKLSGERNPYKDGPLGVIKEGAYADMILVDGNPLQNLKLVADPVKNFDMIMKDGVIYKLNVKKK